MLYILHGADDYSATQQLEEIKKQAGDRDLLATNTSVFEGDKVTADELRVACETAPFLADKRLVIINGLIQRFDPRNPGRGAPARKTDARLTDPTPFATIANATPPSTLLVLIERELKPGNPLYKAISQAASVRSFPSLKSNELRNWIAARVSRDGVNISDAAINLLARMIGGNLWVMSSELQKLALYCAGRRIEENDVRAIVAYTQEVRVFDLVDAIIELNVQKAQGYLQRFMRDGAAPVYVLSMLNRQMRLIVRARELKRMGVADAQIAGRLGVSSEFVAHKAIEQARGYTLPRIRQVYGLLVEADLGIKTGRYEPELALNVLVTELCQPQRH